MLEKWKQEIKETFTTDFEKFIAWSSITAATIWIAYTAYKMWSL